MDERVGFLSWYAGALEKDAQNTEVRRKNERRKKREEVEMGETVGETVEDERREGGWWKRALWRGRRVIRGAPLWLLRC